MSKERDKVKRAIAEIIVRDWDLRKLSGEVAEDILAIPELAVVDRDAELISEISFHLGSLQIEIGNLFENYPTNFNVVMKRLGEILREAGWVKEVKDGNNPRNEAKASAGNTRASD